jgi:hypothetical protein
MRAMDGIESPSQTDRKIGFRQPKKTIRPKLARQIERLFRLTGRGTANTLLVVLSICALPAAPPDLFTYGEIREANGIDRHYAIGTRWRWTWKPVRVSAVARYVGDTSAAYQTDAQGWLWVPKIEGRATIYYGPSAWQREVELR